MIHTYRDILSYIPCTFKQTLTMFAVLRISEHDPSDYGARLSHDIYLYRGTLDDKCRMCESELVV